MVEKEIEKRGLISLYIHFQGETEKWLEHHRRHFTQFVTIILAIMSISFGIVYQFKSLREILLIVIIFPFFNLILSYSGIKICDRFYKRFLEAITIANKLYILINKKIVNIDKAIADNKNIFPEGTYPDDSYLFPIRWINAMKSCCNSQSFIDSRLHGRFYGGSNFWIHVVFWVLIGINIFIIPVIVYIALTSN